MQIFNFSDLLRLIEISLHIEYGAVLYVVGVI